MEERLKALRDNLQQVVNQLIRQSPEAQNILGRIEELESLQGGNGQVAEPELVEEKTDA